MNSPGTRISLGKFATDYSSTSHCPIMVPGYFPPKSVLLIIVVCMVNSLSSFLAATWNFLVLWAIKNTPSLHTPSSVLLFGLALADFVTGFLVQPLFVIHLIGSLAMYSPIYCISGAIAYPLASSLAFVSFSAITAISFDRYLALALHLRYGAIVTVNRVIKFILLAFVFLFPASIYFWFSKVKWFKNSLLCIALVFTIVGMITILFSYIRIFTILRRHQKQIRNQNSLATRSHIDILKYRRSVLTILYVLCTIILSYIPCGISHVIALFSETEVSEFVVFAGGTMLLLNSSINPLVYCWRVKEIRQFVRSKLRSAFGVSGLQNGANRIRQVRPVNDIPELPANPTTPLQA